VSTPELCPAILYDRPEERVVCIHEPHVPGAVGLVCWRCLEIMLRRAADREACEREWEEDK
jgi:hypothetical protein